MLLLLYVEYQKADLPLEVGDFLLRGFPLCASPCRRSPGAGIL